MTSKAAHELNNFGIYSSFSLCGSVIFAPLKASFVDLIRRPPTCAFFSPRRDNNSIIPTKLFVFFFQHEDYYRCYYHCRPSWLVNRWILLNSLFFAPPFRFFGGVLIPQMLPLWKCKTYVATYLISCWISKQFGGYDPSGKGIYLKHGASPPPQPPPNTHTDKQI